MNWRLGGNPPLDWLIFAVLLGVIVLLCVFWPAPKPVPPAQQAVTAEVKAAYRESTIVADGDTLHLRIPAGMTVYPLALESSELYWAKRAAADMDTVKRELREFIATWQGGKVSANDKARAKEMSGGK